MPYHRGTYTNGKKYAIFYKRSGKREGAKQKGARIGTQIDDIRKAVADQLDVPNNQVIVRVKGIRIRKPATVAKQRAMGKALRKYAYSVGKLWPKYEKGHQMTGEERAKARATKSRKRYQREYTRYFKPIKNKNGGGLLAGFFKNQRLIEPGKGPRVDRSAFKINRRGGARGLLSSAPSRTERVPSGFMKALQANMVANNATWAPVGSASFSTPVFPKKPLPRPPGPPMPTRAPPKPPGSIGQKRVHFEDSNVMNTDAIGRLVFQ